MESFTQFLNEVLHLYQDYCQRESNFSFYPENIYLVMMQNVCIHFSFRQHVGDEA